MDPLMINNLVHSEVTDGFALGITILVALTSKSAVGLQEHCRLLLRHPEQPDKWAALGVLDVSAGKWPSEVVCRLVALTKGLSMEHFKEDCMPLTDALEALEAMVKPTLPPPPPAATSSRSSGGLSDGGVSAEARCCAICEERPRQVRFACGHCVA
eukprot:2416521-Prymnesium_polylepis.2